MDSKILLIDDEATIRRMLRINLESRGYKVAEAINAEEGLNKTAAFQPHLVILDLNLPDKNGFEVLHTLRKWTSVPILVLTVDDNELSKVSLLEAGADDYMTKPFSIPELMARIKVSLRHKLNEGATPVFASGALKIDLASRLVTVSDRAVKLTSTEYEFIQILAKNAGRVVAQDFLLSEIWGKHALGNNHYLRIYVGQLRKKLEQDPSSPKHIITEPGVGYRLL